MKKKTLLLLILCGLLSITSFAGWRGFRSYQHAVAAADYQHAQALLTSGKPKEALDLALHYQKQLSWKTPVGLDWLPLLSEALLQTHEDQKLAELYLSYPRLIHQDERKAFAVAGGLIASRQIGAYEQLRKEWKLKRHNEAAWFPLDADALIVQGKKEEAIALLESQRFHSPDDSLRLIRLAVYKAGDDLQMAWDLFTEAIAVDPKNSHLYSYRGQILEKRNQLALARREYELAIEENPQEAVLYNQLAEFYLRQSLVQKAMKTWQRALALPNSDPLRVKLLFWNLVSIPLNIDWNTQPPPQGELTPLIDFLASLPPNQLWDERKFEQIPHYQNLLKNYQETFWLRLADKLLNQQEEKAMDLLTHNIFANELWEPDLAQSLTQILNYRRYGSFGDTASIAPLSNPKGFRHSFFKKLESLIAHRTPEQLPHEWKNLLMGPYAFAIAFLAAGWFKTALDFGIPTSFPETTPQWIPYAYAQAIRYTQSPFKALEFSLNQRTSKPMVLLIGQLMLELGDQDAALAKLEPLRKDVSKTGLQAALEIAKLELERKHYETVKSIVETNSRLQNSYQGKELLAKVAVAEGNPGLADHLYGEIEKQSFEAQFYLAQKARQQKDYARARELIEALLMEFPDNPELLEELNRIKQAQ